jgi:small subunit ribosomal protein S1
VLPVRPITAPVDGEAGDLDNVPELGLSEDVFAGADETIEAPEFTDEASDVTDGTPDVTDGAPEVTAGALEAPEPADADEPAEAEPDA